MEILCAICSCFSYKSKTVSKDKVFFIEIQLTDNVVLLSGTQQSDSVIHTHTHTHTHTYCVLVTQSCPTLCNPMVCSPAGSSVHGIIQARILEWVGLPFPRLGDRPNLGIEPASPALQADYLPSKPLGKPIYIYILFQILFLYRLL